MLRALLACLAVLAAPGSGLAWAEPTVDGIVVIVSDDHRSDLLGAAGHPIVHTPHLDRLARRVLDVPMRGSWRAAAALVAAGIV